ncbi:RNA-directed DNA polymerase from mobile element jockey [Trichonephila clavipes]|nr:RNA-directed DNA polymerase from mobile element jockey [Trichonephila clavipes]
MFGTPITFEPYDGSRNRRPNQCWRCQGFLKSSEVCHLPIRCLKCAGPHQVKDCTLQFEDPLKCANCSGKHAANWRQCSRFQKAKGPNHQNKVQGTKLQPSLDPLIANYRLHKDDRKNFPRFRIDGGTAIYCKNNYDHNRVPLPTLQFTDATAIEIKFNKFPPIRIVSAYARNTPENNRKFPDKDFLKILNSGQNIIIAGDLNAAHHYLPVILTLYTGSALIKIRDQLSTNWENFKFLLNNKPHPIPPSSSNDDPEIAIRRLGENISEALIEASKPKFKQPPLKLPSEIKAKIRHRNRIRKFWQRARDPAVKSEFRTLSREVTKDIRHFFQSRWESHIAALTPETGTLWRKISLFKKPPQNIPPKRCTWQCSKSPSGEGHCIARNIIIREQHGFVTQCSTVTQLLRVTELIHHGFQNNQATGMLFVDIAKAFDKIWHDGLLSKMMRLGFRTNSSKLYTPI